MDSVGWYKGNSGGRNHPVGRKGANGYGVFDMTGNVWEWTCSAYDSEYTGAEQSCAKQDSDADHVLRGGEFNTLDNKGKEP